MVAAVPVAAEDLSLMAAPLECADLRAGIDRAEGGSKPTREPAWEIARGRERISEDGWMDGC